MQRVRFSSEELRLLQSPHSHVSSIQQLNWLMQAQRCNEYRRYDLAYDPRHPRQLQMTVHVYRYHPGRFTFVPRDQPCSFPITLCS